MDTNTIRETFQDNFVFQALLLQLTRAYEANGEAGVQAKLGEWNSSDPGMQKALSAIDRLWHEMNAGAK